MLKLSMLAHVQDCLCLYGHITDHFVSFVSFEFCVDLSSALSLGNFLILTLWLGPHSTVGLH